MFPVTVIKTTAAAKEHRLCSATNASTRPALPGPESSTFNPFARSRYASTAGE